MATWEFNDTALPQNQAVPKGDRGERHQGEEDREEGGYGVEGSVGTGRDDVLLGEHLDRVGDAVKESQRPKAEDAGAVGADPILDEGRLFALHPGMQPRQVQHREENEPRQCELDDQVFHYVTVAPAAGSTGRTSTP